MPQEKLRYTRSVCALHPSPFVAILDTMPYTMFAMTQTSSGDQEAAGPTGAEILAVINATKETLTDKIDMLTKDVSPIRHDLNIFRSHMLEVKDHISWVEDVARSDFTELHALQLQVRALQAKAVDTKNHLCRNNDADPGPARVHGRPQTRGSC